MPIIDVTVVGSVAPKAHPTLAQRLADAAAVALGSRPAGTWVRLHFLPSEHYAENAPEAYTPPQPVFIEVLRHVVPTGDLLKAEVEALTKSVASACGRPPAHVHVLYSPDARGRLAFGGNLVD